MKSMDISICKAQIIIYGIDFQMEQFDDCTSFKTKRKYLQPIIHNKEVFDASKRTEVIPSEIIIEVNGKQSLVKTRHNPMSSIKVKRYEDFLTIVFTKEKFECKGKMIPKNKILNETFFVKEREFRVKDFLSILGLDRISILLFDGCSNWNIGTPCKFCDMHPKPKSQKVFIPSVNELYGCNLKIEEWWNKDKEIFINGLCEAYRRVVKCRDFGPHYHNFIMAGSLPDAFFPWKFTIDLLLKLKKYIIGELIVNLQPHPDKKMLINLKELGVTKVQYNIEVFGEEIYHSTCPDKIRYSLLINKLKEAVEIFGEGNVRSNFVLGLQPLNEVYQGTDMLSEMGVVPDYSIFQPKKNTAYEHHKTADLQDVIECSKYLCKTYKKYGYEPIFCNLSSRSSIMNEMYDDYEEKYKFE